MSHMYPLYPGNQITPRDSPELAKAERISLERRLANGGAYTGWSRAWAIGLWARLGNGDKAWESISMLMQHSTNSNLFDTHPAKEGPIFQIDGNFGAAAGVAEMLLQSQWIEERDGKTVRIISLLPALPKAWPTGSVQGLCARDGFALDFTWENGELKHVVIHSKLGKPCLLRCGVNQIVFKTEAGKDYSFNGKLDPSA